MGLMDSAVSTQTGQVRAVTWPGVVRSGVSPHWPALRMVLRVWSGILWVLRPREVKGLVPGHTACEGPRQDLNPGLSDSDASGSRNSKVYSYVQRKGQWDLLIDVGCKRWR